MVLAETRDSGAFDLYGFHGTILLITLLERVYATHCRTIAHNHVAIHGRGQNYAIMIIYFKVSSHQLHVTQLVQHAVIQSETVTW